MNFYMDDAVGEHLPDPAIQDDIASLKDAYSDYFKIGCACAGSEFAQGATKDLIKKHYNSLTLGNELKPDSVLDQALSQKYVAETGDDTMPQISLNEADEMLKFTAQTLTDAQKTQARTNLGLGTMATQSSVELASDVAGTLPLAKGGTGGATAAAARSLACRWRSTTALSTAATSRNLQIFLMFFRSRFDAAADTHIAVARFGTLEETVTASPYVSARLSFAPCPCREQVSLFRLLWLCLHSQVGQPQ